MTKRSSREARAHSAVATGEGQISSLLYDRIKHDILTLELRPGTKVSEQSLAVRYGLSKAPVRSALAKLVQEGLVATKPRSGHFVAPITLPDMEDLYGMRRLLLPAAARLAAGRVTAELRDAAETALSMELDQSDPEAVLAFCLANRDFIVAFAKASGNALLASFVASLEDRALRILYLMSTSQERTETFREQYQAIYDSLLAGDAAGAEAAVLKALLESENDALKAAMRLPGMRTVNLGGSPAT